LAPKNSACTAPSLGGRSGRRCTHASIIFAIAFCATSADAQKPGTFASESILVGKDKREYRLVVPRSVDLTKPAPLVFAFHGFLIDSKDVMPLYTKLDDTAAKHKFLLVYPNALERSWALTPEAMAKDLAFFDALKKKLTADYKIDADRGLRRRMSTAATWPTSSARSARRRSPRSRATPGRSGCRRSWASGPTASFR